MPLIRGCGVQWPQLTVSVAWGASFLCDPSSFSVSGDGPALGVWKGFHELMGVERWAQCLACRHLLLTELSLVSGDVGQEPVQVWLRRWGGISAPQDLGATPVGEGAERRLERRSGARHAVHADPTWGESVRRGQDRLWCRRNCGWKRVVE